VSPPERTASHVRAFVPWLLAWLLFLPLALMRAGSLTESDTFWQVRTGLLTLTQGSIPTTDSFSWTALGEPWTLNSWGFNVLLALAHRLAGLPGVALAGACAVMLLIALILVAAWRLGAAPMVAGFVLVLMAFPLIAWLSVRPQLVDYIAVLLTVLLLCYLVTGSHPSLAVVALGFLSAIWVNLHAAALLGPAICGVCALILLLRPTSRRRGYWCVAATAAVVGGTLANPYGISLIEQAFRVKDQSGTSIVEWWRPGLSTPEELVVIAIGVCAVAWTIRSRNVVYGAALGVTLAASATAIRFTPIVLVLAVPVLAAAASSPPILRYIRSRRIVLIPGAVLIAATLVVIAIPSLAHIGQPSPVVFPTATVQAIPAGCRLFTSYAVGGFVDLARPDVLVNIDSRNDLFGDRRVRTTEEVLGGKGDVRGALAGADCALIPPTSGLARQLDVEPGWRLAASEDIAALYVRQEP
jgi:hypothetical protein